ncbi:MAG: hypothetical protein OJF61_002355 [Rhodanobacteraceae bacterium]|jgi:O-antigen chain-terminating methyltransferase|nr:MAG: hypothetical protein OJF61_002355 [Rhodanobacteraceae bacterium]
MAADLARLLAAHAALPEPYQPAWGLDASRGVARRDCNDRLAVILPPLEALPCNGTLRILDLGCAQGYFALAIAHALAQHGRRFEIVGVDYLEDNIRFCEALAAHHGLPVRFVHAPVDADFLEAAEGWDVALALNVLHHVQRQQGAAAGVLAAVRAHSRVAFCELAQREEGLEWVGEWHAADDQLLAAYAFHRRLGRFPTHLGEVQRPLYVCSDTQAWVGERWFKFDRAAGRSHAGVPDAFAGQRRFFFGRAEVVKAYRGEGPYGAFNRAELDAEASALAVLSDEPDRYPAVLGRSDDGDMVWLARGLLPGQLLSTQLDSGQRIDRVAVVRGLLGELAHLEARGFHHGDLRCWNVLVDADRVRLIDFGALTSEPSPLHRIALAAVLLEIAEGKLRNDQPFYATLHPLSAYPAAWHGLVRYLLETPQRTFGFARALGKLEAASHGGSGQPGTRLAPAADVIAAAAQEQVDGFRRLQEHLIEAGRRLASAARESVDAAAERAALDDARRTAEAHAVSLAKALEESQHYAESLKQALDESRAFAGSLQARITREAADAMAEREALRNAQAAAATYADSLQAALDESKAFVAALQARIAREADEARKEREVFAASRREAEAHASSLARALAESQAFAGSLQARLLREAADVRAEREAMHVSQREASAHAAALEQALGHSQAYADSLKEALQESQRYAGSLQARLEREAADANRERAKLVVELAGWQARHARMQHRFRLLKFLWPHETEDPKEPE